MYVSDSCQNKVGSEEVRVCGAYSARRFLAMSGCVSVSAVASQMPGERRGGGGGDWQRRCCFFAPPTAVFLPSGP